MLTIDQAVVDAIITHALADHPVLACGLVVGPADSDRPERVIPLDNAERSAAYWRFDSLQQLKVYREIDARNEDVVVIYRSYTDCAAYPSKADIALSAGDDVHHVIVSTRDPENVEFRSFRIMDGRVDEETVTVGPVPPKPARHPIDR
jgi:proteasome lid subunit RPN8/RPN11